MQIGKGAFPICSFAGHKDRSKLDMLECRPPAQDLRSGVLCDIRVNYQLLQVRSALRYIDERLGRQASRDELEAYEAFTRRSNVDEDLKIHNAVNSSPGDAVLGSEDGIANEDLANGFAGPGKVKICPEVGKFNEEVLPPFADAHATDHGLKRQVADDHLYQLNGQDGERVYCFGRGHLARDAVMQLLEDLSTVSLGVNRISQRIANLEVGVSNWHILHPVLIDAGSGL